MAFLLRNKEYALWLERERLAQIEFQAKKEKEERLRLKRQREEVRLSILQRHAV
jgi:hypothetical protein